MTTSRLRAGDTRCACRNFRLKAEATTVTDELLSVTDKLLWLPPQAEAFSRRLHKPMHLRSIAANILWTGAAVGERRRYRRALRDPLGTQHAILSGYLRANQETLVGRSWAFPLILASAGGKAKRDSAAMRDLIADYQSRVPLAKYDALEPLIGRIVRGEHEVLTCEPVRRLVPSSGSTAAAKLVPYTASLQTELSRAVDAWIADLYLRRPGLAAGPAYWSISPAIPAPPVVSSVPIGFDDDSAYLGGARRALAQALMAVPDGVARVTDADAFRYITLLFLARARDLRLISVWHPSFLTRLVECLPAWLERIAADLARGTLSPPGTVPADVRASLVRRLRPEPARASELRRLTRADLSVIWPRLSVVSCWADGPARSYAEALAQGLPGVAVQAKGLVATEAFVTIPFALGHPVAVRSHFFEFLDAGRPCLVSDLERGVEYSVVVTTGGGLYRYQLGDRVAVDGWIERTPSLRFLGREDRVSDWFGEKLSEGFVAGALEALWDGVPRPRFAMVAPERLPAGIAYTLFVDVDDVLLPRLASKLERELRRNPHYAWCVDLGQLSPARVVRVGPDADRAYVDACVLRGQRLGDVKPALLQADSGWASVLERCRR